MRLPPQRLSVVTMILAFAVTAGGCGPRYHQSNVAPISFPSERPYLFFRSDDIPRMKQTIETVTPAATIYSRMITAADPSREVEYPVPGALTQPDWARVSGQMGAMAARCGVLYQLTGDARYADWVRRMLLGWAREFDTKVDFRLCGDYRGHEVGHAGEGGNTMGYYFVGHLLTRTALAYDCVADTLSAEDRQTIERDFFGKWVASIEDYDHSRRMPGMAADFMTSGGQWNGANLCSMGLAAVGFALGDERLAARGVRNFKTYLARDLLADGFWTEEDRAYSDTCLSSLFTVAWMARSSGYSEDLFRLVVEALPTTEYDPRYFVDEVTCDGPAPAERRLTMFLDAQIDYQYPTLGPGNWGWIPGRGSLARSGLLIGMLEAGHGLTGKGDYGWILSRLQRTRGHLGLSGLGILYFGRSLKTARPETRSRWYRHNRWVVLKSIEGRDYWDSDALYAFLPYSVGRNKGLQPLTLDLFAFGRVLAPRTTIRDYAQNLTKSYQLNEPAWNTVMVDGCILSTFRGRSDRSHMAYYETGPLAKVAAPRVHWIGERRTELDTPNVERHPEDDRTMGRTLLLTDRYLLDVFHVVYDRRPRYKHNFDYVLHGVGKTLSLDTPGRSGGRFADQAAIWRGDDGVGLMSTILTAMPRGGTKLKRFRDPGGEYVVATRANYEEWFAVVHEPFRGAAKIKSIRQLADEPDAVAVEIAHRDGTVDLVAVRTKETAKAYRWRSSTGQELRLDGNYHMIRIDPEGRQTSQGK